jgi:hypothetical protein
MGLMKETSEVSKTCEAWRSLKILKRGVNEVKPEKLIRLYSIFFRNRPITHDGVHDTSSVDYGFNVIGSP